MPRLSLGAFTLGAIAVGVVLLFGPNFVLELVTTQEWEMAALRYLGLFSVILGLQWDWAKHHGGTTLRPARRRVAVVWGLLAIYVFTMTGLFLIVTLSLLVAAVFEIGLERAMAYSEALRRQIDPPNRHLR